MIAEVVSVDQFKRCCVVSRKVGGVKKYDTLHFSQGHLSAVQKAHEDGIRIRCDVQAYILSNIRPVQP